MRALVALGCLAASGCMSTTQFPGTYSHAGFSSEQAEVLKDVVDAWCQAANWCMEETEWPYGGLVFTMVDDYEDYGRKKNSAAFYRSGRIVLDSQMPYLKSNPIYLWDVLAHEMVHVCDLSHLPIEGWIMSETMRPEAPPPPMIDFMMVRMVRNGCHE